MLAGVEWRKIVLDEAQAIKNFSTKRSKAAMNLRGDFKLITTGTPIENHLGECHLAEEIESYFRDGQRFGVYIGYSFEGRIEEGELIGDALGSAGGLRRIQDFNHCIKGDTSSFNPIVFFSLLDVLLCWDGG